MTKGSSVVEQRTHCVTLKLVMWFAVVADRCGWQLQGDVDCSHQKVELLLEKSVDEAQTSVLTIEICNRNINVKVMNINRALNH